MALQRATIVVLAVASTLFGQVHPKNIRNSIKQFELKSTRRHMLRESNKILNTRLNISSYELYPQLTQQTGCRQPIDFINDPSQSSSSENLRLSQVCTDDVCLVEAMYAKTPIIIITSDIDISNSLPLPVITTNMTIKGKCIDHACIIDAFGVGQMFLVNTGGQLTLRNLEIRGGYDSQGGAAVLVTGSNSDELNASGKLLALNVLFFNNTASGHGGAILVKRRGALHIQNSVFDSNEASEGGAVYVQSSANNETSNLGCKPNSCATFVGTTFKGNWADLGGALFINEGMNCIEPGKFECTTCNFQDNFALVDGGAIFLARKAIGAVGIVKFSNFSNNKVEVASDMTGGAVSIQAGEPGITGAKFFSYKTTYSQSSDYEIAISVKAYANATLTHSNFLNSNAITCYGTCNFCPTLRNFYILANSSQIPTTTPVLATTCPNIPPPLCDWIPLECNLPLTIEIPTLIPH